MKIRNTSGYLFQKKTYLEVKAFGVNKSNCGDEWLAGDASVACCTDDARL